MQYPEDMNDAATKRGLYVSINGKWIPVTGEKQQKAAAAMLAANAENVSYWDGKTWTHNTGWILNVATGKLGGAELKA